MNRREALTFMAAAAAVPAMGQTNDLGGMNLIRPVPPSPEDRKREYAICKVRGHSLEYPNNFVTVAIYPPPPPPNPVCKYCGTEVWTETIQHEKGSPE